MPDLIRHPGFLWIPASAGMTKLEMSEYITFGRKFPPAESAPGGGKGLFYEGYAGPQ
jgi:hypothetical protein